MDLIIVVIIALVCLPWFGSKSCLTTSIRIANITNDYSMKLQEDESHLKFFYIALRLQNDKNDPEKLHIVYYILGNALNNFVFIFDYMSACGLVYMSADAVESREIRLHGAGVTGGYKQPDVVSRHQTWIVCKNSMGF